MKAAAGLQSEPAIGEELYRAGSRVLLASRLSVERGNLCVVLHRGNSARQPARWRSVATHPAEMANRPRVPSCPVLTQTPLMELVPAAEKNARPGRREEPSRVHPETNVTLTWPLNSGCGDQTAPVELDAPANGASVGGILRRGIPNWRQAAAVDVGKPLRRCPDRQLLRPQND